MAIDRPMNMGWRQSTPRTSRVRSRPRVRVGIGRDAETPMTSLIEELWSNLKSAGLPEVMLYLPDGTASRCHWDNTTMVGDVRVALLGDQERGIVRIVPVAACTGLGIASPKGTDPNGYRAVVLGRLTERPVDEEPAA